MALSGSGSSAADPYLIKTAAELKELADQVNGGDPCAGEYFRLEADITLSGEWIPIGTEQNPFKGTFDGAGHTISGLSINNNAAEDGQGLFGYINTAKIQNLTVQGSVNVAGTKKIYVGGIVGYNKGGTVTNCRNEGTANVAGKRIYVGGIVGFNNGGIVTNCRNENTIKISDGNTGSSFVGGIVGQVYVGTVTNCRNQGKVMDTKQIACAGGIVGGNNNAEATTIENCWNESAVTGNNAGGIMGQAYSSTPTTIENCWNEGAVTGENAGGIVGYNQEKEIITNCGNQGEVMGDDAGEIVGYNNLYSGNTTMTNCYYLDTTANEDVGYGTVEGTAEVKTSTEFASGEVTWLLENGQEADEGDGAQNGQEADEGDGAQKTLVWGQQLGVDSFPRLACFMEEDEKAKETKRVLKVAFCNAANDGTYTEYGDKPYINKGTTVQDAGGVQVNSQGYPAAIYEAVWLDSAELTGTDYSGKVFRKDTPIEKDTNFYLFYKELFSSENTALTVSSGTAETKDLDECMKYAGSGSTAGNFTYEITAGNDTLKATVAGNKLTIPSAAASGRYELTIKATEKESLMKNRKDSVTSTGVESVTFTVNVSVESSDEERVAEAEEKLEGILEVLIATNDTTKEDIEKQIRDQLAEKGYGDVTVTVEITEREEATTEKEGKLKGNVTILKGSAIGQKKMWEATISKLTVTSSGVGPSVEPTEEPQETPTPDENTDDDQYQKIGLMSELKVTQKGKKIQVEWGKEADADGYFVYVQYCGKKFAKKATQTLRKSSTTEVEIAQVNGKKLKLKKNFKVYVAAYKTTSGKRIVIKKTMTGHIVGKKNYKYTNAKKVKVTENKITLEVGKTTAIKAKTVRVDKDKKLLPTGHGKKYRYKSIDDSIATVSKDGTITAVGKGTCSVYVFAQNGCAGEIKVTVK